MTIHEASTFLQAHQPMQPDPLLDEQDLVLYNQARECLLDNPDPVAIPLLLTSFGEGGGYGVYQLVEDVIGKYSPLLVLPHLITALHSEHSGVRYWCAQIASRFPSAELIDPLARLIREDSSAIAYAAVTAMEQIDDDLAIQKLEELLKQVTTPEIRELIREVLSDREHD